MKKTFTILGILVVAALVATLWERVDDAFLRKTHPQKYAESVEKYAAEYDVPESVVYAVIKTESGFTPDAVSLKGAIGLMQITPDTFDWLCSKTGDEANALLLYEPDTNIRYGTYFLSLLYSEFGVWDTAFAAYNAGRGRVNEWLKSPAYNSNGKLVNIPYPETAAYVQKVDKAMLVYKKLYFSKTAEAADAADLTDAPDMTDDALIQEN